jgi:hypothetical protein
MNGIYRGQTFILFPVTNIIYILMTAINLLQSQFRATIQYYCHNLDEIQTITTPLLLLSNHPDVYRTGLLQQFQSDQWMNYLPFDEYRQIDHHRQTIITITIHNLHLRFQ